METYHNQQTDHHSDEKPKSITVNFWVVLTIIGIIGILIVYFGLR